jgi:hypothetical protein
MNDFFRDVQELTEKSPLYGKGKFVVAIRYALDEEGALFEMIFFPHGERPKIVAKWIIDLLKMSEEGATHRELFQQGLKAIHEAYDARGY